MKLAQKFTLALALILIFVTAIRGYLDTQRAVDHYVSRIRTAHRELGNTLGAAVVTIWQQQGWESALRFLGEVESTQGDTRIRWTWLEEDARPEYRPTIPVPELLAMMSDDSEVSIEPRERGGAIISYKPVNLKGLPRGALEFTRSTAQEEAFVRSEREGQFLTSAVLVLVYVLVATSLGRRWVGAPIEALIAHARRVGAGDFAPSTEPILQRDEIGVLAGEMARMSESLETTRQRAEQERAARLEVQAQLRHADRLAAVGRLAATLIHEVGTPLNVVSGRARMIADGDVEGPELVESARRIHEQATRIASTMRGLLDYARQQAAVRERLQLASLAVSTVSLLGPLARVARVELVTAGEPVEVEVDGDQLGQVLVNLITNAIQALPGGGTVSVSTGTRRAVRPGETEERRWAVLSVRDGGIGIAESDVEKIFQPFYTTKPAGEGTGLGLNVCKTIVEAHGGWIGVESAVGQGTTFTVHLPLERSTETAEDAGQKRSAP